MQSQVIVPLDGSASAEAILPHALLFAQRGQSILTLLQIGTPSGLPGVRDRMIPDNWSEGEEIWGQDYLATMARRLQSSGVTIQTRHPEAALAEQAIVSYSKHQPQVQLIALTTQGRSAAGRALFGSLAEQVFASVSTSLLLLHPPKGEQTGSGPIVSASYQTIIVLLDGSVEAERALHEATSLAQEFSATLVLVAVPPRPGEEIFVSEGEQPVSDSPEEKAQLLRTTTGLRVETAATARDPEAFIEQLTGHGQGNLLVVATREQALYGAEKFLRHRNVPVLLLATYT
ncbi:MAG: universal stress protein [Chloroflexi bacterium]|nr:MAG: universal stress protein [Chloroflexota bacterium]